MRLPGSGGLADAILSIAIFAALGAALGYIAGNPVRGALVAVLLGFVNILLKQVMRILGRKDLGEFR